MTALNPATKLPQPITWLHAYGAPIVAYSAHTVDGARLPYTRAQAARYEARTGQSVTMDKELPTAAGY